MTRLGLRWSDPVMQKEDEKRIAARQAKVMALMCVRNSKLENIHAEIVPVTRTGDYSDVTVLDAGGARSRGPRSRTLTTTKYRN